MWYPLEIHWPYALHNLFSTLESLKSDHRMCIFLHAYLFLACCVAKNLIFCPYISLVINFLFFCGWRQIFQQELAMKLLTSEKFESNSLFFVLVISLSNGIIIYPTTNFECRNQKSLPFWIANHKCFKFWCWSDLVVFHCFFPLCLLSKSSFWYHDLLQNVYRTVWWQRISKIGKDHSFGYLCSHLHKPFGWLMLQGHMLMKLQTQTWFMRLGSYLNWESSYHIYCHY